jgi:tetratricopeptide (TPR) repeat protein
MRTQVEALWGLCRAYGYGGDLPAAEEHAGQALKIVRRSGDEWVENLVQGTLGAGYALAGRTEQARKHLDQAREGFERVGDPFGQAAAWLWLALDATWQGEPDAALAHLAELLPLAREQGYEALLVRRTFTGLADEQAAVSLLLAARKAGIERQYAARLLDRMGMAEVEDHPGYRLSVRALGPFAVWRGHEVVAFLTHPDDTSGRLGHESRVVVGPYPHRKGEVVRTIAIRTARCRCDLRAE